MFFPCSLALVIGGKVVNIYCCKEGKDLLIVAAPADRLVRLLLFLHREAISTYSVLCPAS